ncbi:hypothetical protein COU12_01725 [Candidatus Jorgensenbacteria bacterium CG10_big_fil_rev_8_21_14_0_10_54_38]|uniref:SHS2 domain-containing protein n=2 Tax=Candidatus Joergenseniibacteriota TaxID=1752739 RepID=A0A2M6WFW4_9BACT|nr:MAG: hypothetical protein COX26_00410 [Candidatus Jorgensenbacteria bacterium CG23_combo_of_CG06-09_8_20_14_all_54_14]PIT91698.1 MAG: hypothetical protein COU12_01725 [Candidatus Jorgensenbacteria bacterium CG10_big_fil_rev_8_21_14_0_10_54_38]
MEATKRFLQRIGRAILGILNIRLDGAFGIDISDGSIEILELKPFGNFRVATYGRAILEEGITRNGEIIKAEILKRKIAETLSQASPRKISTNRVIASLPESKIFLHHFELPFVDKRGWLKSIFYSRKKELRRRLSHLVEEEVRKLIPYDMGSIYYDWQLLPAPLGVKEPRERVIFVGAPKDIVDKYVTVMSELGLTLVALDIESMSLARTLLEKEDFSQMIVDIGSRTSNVSIFDQSGFLRSSVSVPVAGQEFTDAIAEKLKVPEEEAEKIKKTVGLRLDGPANILPILEPKLAEIVQGIKGAIEHHEGSYFQPVKRIILAGGSALLPKLDEYLAKQLEVEVSVANPSKIVRWKKVLGKNAPEAILFATVAGLAMRGSSSKSYDINLLNQVPAEKFEVPRKLDLLTLGYLRKTTAIRTFITSNSLLVLFFLSLVFAFSGFVMYQQAIRPFYEAKKLSATSLPVMGMPEGNGGRMEGE